ncbi:MAG: XdhC family protein [Bacillota bacterium]|nr:XdhC family protein [Bacillota bacterium]
MGERELLLEAIEEARRSGRRAALATVVRVRGSAYRREGAKLLVHEDGRIVGTVSGGCVEADIAEVARQVMEGGKPLLRHYELDDETVWSLGLGCGGALDVYVEPLPEAGGAGAGGGGR